MEKVLFATDVREGIRAYMVSVVLLAEKKK
jgi:hypothetical protein